MKTWAIVRNGRVGNIIEWDGSDSWSPSADSVAIDITAMENQPEVGYTYEDGVFKEPAPPKRPVPEKITRRQCSLELLNRQMITDVEALDMTRNGTPPAIVSAYIQTLPVEQQIRAEIDFAAENYYRNNELLIAMMTANNWSSDDIDDFFIAAGKL